MNRIVLALSFASTLLLAFSAGCGSSSGSTGAGGCYETSGSGASMMCIETNAANGNCTSPAQSGTCPTSGLFGCCTVTSDGESVATCVYSKNTETEAEMAACKGGGTSGTWSTSP
jgi:hypothetical protein